MSEQSSKVTHHQLRERLKHLRATNNAGMFGMNEIIGISGSAFVLVIVIISYVYFLLPARSNLEASKAEHARLQALLDSSKKVVNDEETAESAARNIADSLDSFESQYLFSRTQGRTDLYEVLNQLMRANNLRNTSGPTYTVLEPAGTKGPAGSRSAHTKWQTVYPGIAISVTVEGPYVNLRKFVHDIEASKLFVVINSVELERASESSNALNAEPSGTKASLVSLRLDMATYFQRAVVETASEPATTH
jgi:Tfp pilus assembly protein PilO